MIKCTLTFHSDDTYSEKHNLRMLDKNGKPYYGKNVHTELEKENIYFNNCRTLEKFYQDEFQKSYEDYRKKISIKHPERAREMSDTYLGELIKKEQATEKKKQELLCKKAHIKDIKKIDKYVRPAKELIVQLGDKDGEFNTITGSNKELSKDILKDYMNNFENRNPGLKIVSAAIHSDEYNVNDTGEIIAGTVHLHLIYCPVVKSKTDRGMTIKNSQTQAYASMGLSTGKTEDGKFLTAQEQWQKREREHIKELCKTRSIEITNGTEKFPHESVKDFQRRQNEKRAMNVLSRNLEKKSIDIETKSIEVEEKVAETEELNKKALEMYSQTEEKINTLSRTIDSSITHYTAVSKGLDDFQKTIGGMYKINEKDLYNLLSNSRFAKSYMEKELSDIKNSYLNLPYINKLYGAYKSAEAKNNELTNELIRTRSELVVVKDETKKHEAIFTKLATQYKNVYDDISEQIGREQQLTFQKKNNRKHKVDIDNDFERVR